MYALGVHQVKSIGFLPQGAPTSPDLANLVMRAFDERTAELAAQSGLVYSRYADDLIFSTRNRSQFTRVHAKSFIHSIYNELTQIGFEANRTKTTICPPRARKIVLGLLVDRDTPRLTKQFRTELETHAYFLSSAKHGPIEHAERRGFTSVIGMQNYLNGLLAHAAQVDLEFAQQVRAKMRRARWPI